MINIIIFSKDRAAQLDLLLRSLKQHFKEYALANIYVLYSTSSEEYTLGYNLLQKEFENVSYIDDMKFGSFKSTLINLIDTRLALTMFLVDDIVLKDTFSINDNEIRLTLEHEQIIATSLRLWKGIEYCYATNQPSPVPNFVKKNIWNWTNASGDWGYPMSVDGNIYRTNFILEKINQIEFENPNQLEAGLASRPDMQKSYMSCYVEGSKLLNIPANIVQQTYKNRHGNIMSIDVLNQKFINGYRINYMDWLKYKNSTVHVELEYKWSKNVNTI